MLIDGDKVEVGTPVVKGMNVSAKVVDELVKGEKCYIVVKKLKICCIIPRKTI